MELTITRTSPSDPDEPVVLEVIGPIDLSTRQTLIDAAVTAFLVSRILHLDASGVDSIDAVGLEALIEIATMAKREGATFELTGRSPQVQQALERVGLGTAWP